MDPTFIISFILILLCLLGLSWFRGSDAPYVPTISSSLLITLKFAGVKKGKVFYELGSGDGRVVIDAAKLGAKAIGIEQSKLRVWLSKYKAQKLNLSNAFFIHGNIFNQTYKDGDFIFIYLLPPAVKKLEKKLTQELKKGSIIITQKYHFPSLKPFKKIENFNLYRI